MGLVNSCRNPFLNQVIFEMKKDVKNLIRIVEGSQSLLKSGHFRAGNGQVKIGQLRQMSQSLLKSGHFRG